MSKNRDYSGIPLKNPVEDRPHKCSICDGHGEWRKSTGLIVMCQQCFGWGYTENDIDCVHRFKVIGRSGRYKTRWQCQKCGFERLTND